MKFTNEQKLLFKLASIESHIPYEKIINEKISADEWMELTSVMAKIAEELELVTRKEKTLKQLFKALDDMSERARKEYGDLSLNKKHEKID